MKDSKKKFHFYSLKWHDKKVTKVHTIYNYSDDEKVNVYNSLKNSDFFPNNQDSNRYKIHDVKYIDNKWIIYWYFVQYYNEHIKTIENPKWENVVSSEWYLFIYYIDENRMILQHKKWMWDKPWVWIIKKRFFLHYQNILKDNQLPYPHGFQVEELWRDRKEFLETFFNDDKIITQVDIEWFDSLNMLWKETQDEKIMIQNTKSIKADAIEGKSLSKIPIIQTAMKAWVKHKKMLFHSSTNFKEEKYVEKGASSIEAELNSDISISESHLWYLFNEVDKFVRWRKAFSLWEYYEEKQGNILYNQNLKNENK